MERQACASAVRRIRRNRPLVILIVILAPVLPTPELACAHGVIGNRIFLSPIVGNDAFPDNAVSLTARDSDYEFSLLPQFEKQLSDNSSLLFTGGWTRIAPAGRLPTTEGATDLSIWFRRAVFKSPPHELQLAVSPFLIAPIGNQRIPDQGYAHLGGDLLLGKGFGDLANFPSLKYLRPLAVQVEAGYAGRIEGPANSDVFSNLELEYSLRYLNEFVQRVDVRRPLIDLVPYVQLNYTQSFSASPTMRLNSTRSFFASTLTAKPDFRLTPGLAYLGDYWEVSVGAQVALNGAASRGDRLAALGLVEIFYDDIFPALGWNPF